MALQLRQESFQDFLNDVQAENFRKDVIALAATRDLPIEFVVIALADLLGMTAAQLDARDGRCTLESKLHSFCVRVEQTYERVRHGTANLKTNNGGG